MTELFRLDDICKTCGTGHLVTPCAGGKRCTCACRKCGERFRHKPEAANAETAARTATHDEQKGSQG